MNLYRPWALFVVHVYIENMQYIVRSCYAGLCNTNHYTTRSPHIVLHSPSTSDSDGLVSKSTGMKLASYLDAFSVQGR